MKKSLFIVLSFVAASLYAQGVQPPSEGKAVVYFVRTSSLGALMNFQYFDMDKFIGKFNGPKYMRYECEPGQHVFWARSENADFVAAELEAGRVYFLQARPQMGAIKAQVQLVPVDPKDAKTMEKIMKLLSKKQPEQFTEDELSKENTRLQVDIAGALVKYEDRKKQGRVDNLTKEMYYEAAK